jgi:Na+-transporting methylmalonyl-CoA/oxaloacetate decarboxylase gamma subunit
MTNWSFGLTMTFMGMGITLITLYLLTLLIRLLNKLFPHKIIEDGGKGKPVNVQK